jgi:N12 class adenine-specific DNA methylase
MLSEVIGRSGDLPGKSQSAGRWRRQYAMSTSRRDSDSISCLYLWPSAAREAQQKIKDRFSEWIWQDEERARRLARFYNDRFNNIRLRTYDGSHLTFSGLNRSLLGRNDLDKHQKDAVLARASK